MLSLARRLPRRPRARAFTVLALESSADDSCAAIVSSAPRILANVVLKQHAIHQVYGGIHPKYAILGHQHNIPLAVRRALDEAQLDVRTDIDGIAFTRGPGIGGCLSVSSNAAKSLAAALGLPLVGQAHALTPLLTAHPNPPTFPFLTLLVSGGHTLLLLASSLTSFRTLATTADESIGRSFDKVSRHLGIPWAALGPGAALEHFCAQPFDGADLPPLPAFPRPCRGQLAFSYASLHSYVERYLDAKGGLDNTDLPTRLALARGFQTAAVAQLEEKLLLAFRWCLSQGIRVQDVVVSGGVASNAYLRERLAVCVAQVDSGSPIRLSFPPPELCTDRRNPQTKKHKTWDGDAILVANTNKATLYDIDGKTIGVGKATFPLEEGKEYLVANKVIELDRPLTKSEYLSGRAFGSSTAPETPPVALHNNRLKPFVPHKINPSLSSNSVSKPPTRVQPVVPVSASDKAPDIKGGTHWTANWRKPQQKKHQTWDGDAYVSLAEGKLIMLSEDGELMGSVPWKGGNLSSGYRTMIGGREVELDSQVEASLLPHIYKAPDSGNNSPDKDAAPASLASPEKFVDQVSRFVAPVSFYGATVPKKSKGPL
ncbi:hypothetical protein C0993_004446 [Termitomyces sp. T159_Od127]|nr:hypothetical protein C0993_004446 [Termitomyces sp. T159_Od127]